MIAMYFLQWVSVIGARCGTANNGHVSHPVLTESRRLVDPRAKDVEERVWAVFSGLSPLVVEGVADEGKRIVVRARTSQDISVCPLLPTGRARLMIDRCSAPAGHLRHWGAPSAEPRSASGSGPGRPPGGSGGAAGATGCLPPAASSAT